MRKPSAPAVEEGFAGFSIEGHQQLGSELAQTREWLLYVGLEICNAYGFSSQAGRKAKAAVDKLDQLRLELENCLALEVGPDCSPEIYFPSRESIEAVQ
jgi:hypothetical protein